MAAKALYPIKLCRNGFNPRLSHSRNHKFSCFKTLNLMYFLIFSQTSHTSPSHLILLPVFQRTSFQLEKPYRQYCQNSNKEDPALKNYTISNFKRFPETYHLRNVIRAKSSILCVWRAMHTSVHNQQQLTSFYGKIINSMHHNSILQKIGNIFAPCVETFFNIL